MLVPRFHLITPVVPVARLVTLAEAGVEAIQVRDKFTTDRAVHAFVLELLAAVRPLGVRVLLNDRVDIALAAGADGVHLGADDLPVAAVRRIAPDLLLGATCRTRDEALAAAADGADYAGVGPVHPTTSKTGLPDPLGPHGLAAVAGALPMVAIGGIDATRVAAVLAAGAHGVAVIGAVAHAPDPPSAAKEIAAALAAA